MIVPIPSSECASGRKVTVAPITIAPSASAVVGQAAARNAGRPCAWAAVSGSPPRRGKKAMQTMPASVSTAAAAPIATDPNWAKAQGPSGTHKIAGIAEAAP